MKIIDLFKKKCPKCGSTNITRVTESFWKKLRRFVLILMLFILALFLKGSKPLNVCRDCGFSWEDR